MGLFSHLLFQIGPCIPLHNFESFGPSRPYLSKFNVSSSNIITTNTINNTQKLGKISKHIKTHIKYHFLTNCYNHIIQERNIFQNALGLSLKTWVVHKNTHNITF